MYITYYKPWLQIFTLYKSLSLWIEGNEKPLEELGVGKNGPPSMLHWVDLFGSLELEAQDKIEHSADDVDDSRW